MEQKTIRITDLIREAKYSQRTNKPYTSLKLKSKEYGDRFLSGFGNKDNEHWNIGDEVSIIVTESEKTDRTGRPYLNFETPKSAPAGNTNFPPEVVALLKSLNLKVDAIYKHIIGNSDEALEEALGSAPDDEDIQPRF